MMKALLPACAVCLLVSNILCAGEAKEYASSADLLGSLSFPPEGIAVTVEGPPLKTPSGNLGCVYGESAILYYTKSNRPRPSRVGATVNFSMR